MSNGNLPANPVTSTDCLARTMREAGPAETMRAIGGMTKREYIAALAMQGMSGGCFTGGKGDIERAAMSSVMMADALLAELEK